jgi:hypothetical protein
MIHSLAHRILPDIAERLQATILALGMCAAASPAWPQSPDEVKDGMRIMAGSAAVCSDYLKRPEVLEEARQSGRYQLGEIGLSEAEADALMDQAIARARAEEPTETGKQIACEIINIQALE